MCFTRLDSAAFALANAIPFSIIHALSFPLMKLAIRACALSIVIAFAAHIAWAGGGSVHVRGYVRKDGTYVAPYTRSAPRSKSYSTASALSRIRTPTPNISSGVTPNAPTTSRAATEGSLVPTATVVPLATRDLRSSTQRVQDAITAGRIVVKDTKPTVI